MHPIRESGVIGKKGYLSSHDSFFAEFFVVPRGVFVLCFIENGHAAVVSVLA